ncbi:hypothetical protein N9N67_05235 [Bacteriovoracaceae bacterium]|nr:hypothetical protein [Bacteriovoracaceae bacterium]
MKKMKLTIAVLMAASLSTFGQSTSTGKVKSPSSSSFMKDISLTYFAAYTGPSVMELDTTSTRNNEGEIDDDGINLFNAVKLSYRLPNGWKLYTQGRFMYYFDPLDDVDNYEGLNTRTGVSGISLSDAAVSASLGGFIETADSIGSQSITTTSDGLDEGRLVAKPAIYMVNAYSITPANSISMYSRVRWSMYDNNEVAAEKPYYDVYLEPNYVYTINDSFGLKLAYEYQMIQMNGDESIADGKEADPFAMKGTNGTANDILVGAIINIGNTELNPWISYTPIDSYSQDSTTIGFYMSTTLF